MERNPCLGRNIEDSEAELYAEYHGEKTDNLSSSALTEDGLKTRQRNITKGKSPKKKLFAKEPDLTGTIDTDFSCSQSSKNNPSQSASASSPAAGAQQVYDFQNKFQGLYDEHLFILKDSVSETRANVKSEKTTANIEVDRGGEQARHPSETDSVLFEAATRSRSTCVERLVMDERGDSPRRWSAG